MSLIYQALQQTAEQATSRPLAEKPPLSTPPTAPKTVGGRGRHMVLVGAAMAGAGVLGGFFISQWGGAQARPVPAPAPAGAIMVRDVRAWHGGTPNVSDAIRSIPNLEFYAPWFREPIVPGITYGDYRKLSERAQKLVRHCVADSSETLVTGTTLRAP